MLTLCLSVCVCAEIVVESISNTSAAATAAAVPLRGDGIVSLMKTVCFQTQQGADSVHRTAATKRWLFFFFF